jgi:alkylated DNA repair dioxygenase AlkB
VVPPIPGLRYVPDYIRPEAAARLLATADEHGWGRGGGRGVQIYGFSYAAARGGIYRIGDLPPWVHDLATQLAQDGLMPYVADQMLANDYQPGAGIPTHVDLDLFADTIVSISLVSASVMDFIEPSSNRQEHLLLEPGSALVLSGEARSTWKHGITPRSADEWDGRVIPRGRRVSLTFRKMLDSAVPQPA